MSSVTPVTTLVFYSFSGNSLVYLIVLFRQKFPLVSVIVVVGLANLSCCCDHCGTLRINQTKKCETKDSSLRINFVLEPRDWRFPGSLSLSLRRARSREPWERGCCWTRAGENIETSIWKGPASCGKTFLVNLLTSTFKKFSNPATAMFAWVGAEDAKILCLNDFRWSPHIIP